tara:strand:+ start:119 stop:610 length:492 start_codon:yes stop_codon:yes gene_type:complete
MLRSKSLLLIYFGVKNKEFKNMNKELPFSQVIPVRFSDLDAQGHLYFANYLVYGDEVVSNYMEELGLNIMDPSSTPCLIFTVNINCEYINEMSGGSEATVCVGYSRLGNSSADVVFEIYNSKPEKLMAKGSMTQVFVDPTTRKSMPIPDFYRGGVIENQPNLA